MDDLVALFASVGLAEGKIKEATGNKKISGNLETAIKEVGRFSDQRACRLTSALQSGIIDKEDKSAASLLFTLASTIPKDAVAHLPYIARAVVDGKIKTVVQIEGTFSREIQPLAGPSISLIGASNNFI